MYSRERKIQFAVAMGKDRKVNPLINGLNPAVKDATTDCLPSPLVTEHAQAFRHLFSDYRQFQHFENYLTGLIVLENKSLATSVVVP